MADEIKDKLDSVAQAGIQRARGDAGETELVSLPDLIAADKYLNGKLDFSTSKVSRFRALIMKVQHPGTLGNE